MKLFKLFSLLGVFALAVLATGCSNDDFQEAEKKSSEIITITASAPSEGEDTRVAFDKDNFSLSWKVGDAFQVYGDAVAGEKFTCASVSSGRGAFNGNRPSFAGTKHAFYPAAKTNNADGNGYEFASFDYRGQIQIGNDNVDELSSYLYMTGTVSEDNTVNNFVLHPAILKLTIQMPTDFAGSVEQVDVQFGSTPMKSKHYKNASWQDLDETSSTQSVLLDGVSLSVDENLVVYMAISPINVANDTFTLTVTDGLGGKYVRELTGFSYNFEGGKVVPGLFSVELFIENLGTISELRQYYADQNTTSQVAYTKNVVGVVTASIGGKTFIHDGVSGLYVERNLTSGIAQGDNVVVALTGLDASGGRLEAYADSYSKYETGTLTLDDVLVERTIAEIKASSSSNSEPNVPIYSVIRGASLTSLDKGSLISQGGDEIKIYGSSYSGDIPVGACDVYGVNYSNGSNQEFIVTNIVAGEVVPSMSFTVDPVDNILSEGQNVTVAVKSNVSWKVVLKHGETEISSQEGSNSQDVTVAIPANASITESASYTVELICLDAETTLTADPVALTQLKAGEEPASTEVSLFDFHTTVSGWSLPKYDITDVAIRGVVVYQEADKIYLSDKTAGFCCYKYREFTNFVVGDVCVVTPSELKEYHGLVEATKGAFEKVVDETQDETSVLVDVTIDEIKNAADTHYQGMYVRLSGVSPSATNWANKTTLSKNGVSISTYNNASLAALNTVECTLDALCVVDYYDGYRLMVMSVENIKEPGYINLSADISSAIAIDGSVDPTITVESNVTWTAQVSGEGASLLTDASTILVDLPANTTGVDKIYTVTVTSTEDASLVKTIELVQSGPYISDLAADKSNNLLADGSEDPVVTVDANVSWTPEVSGGATIFDYDATSIIVDLPENTTDQEVTYTVTVTSTDGTIVKTIDLVQLGAGAVIVASPGAINGSVVEWSMTKAAGTDLVREVSIDDWIAKLSFAFDGATYKTHNSGFKIYGVTPKDTPQSNNYFEIEVPVKSISSETKVNVFMHTDADTGGGPMYMYAECSFDDGVSYVAMPEEDDTYIYDVTNKYYYVGRGDGHQGDDRPHNFTMTTDSEVSNTTVRVKVYFFKGLKSGSGVYVSKKNKVIVSFSE